MSKIIAPLSDPEELRAEAAHNTPTRSVVPAKSLDIPDSKHRLTNNAAIDELRTPIGIYVIGGLVALSGLAIMFMSGPLGVVTGLPILLVAVGLIMKHNLARQLFVVVCAINLLLALSNFLAVIGFTAVMADPVGSDGYTAGIWSALITAGISTAGITYFSLPKVKEQFS